MGDILIIQSKTEDIDCIINEEEPLTPKETNETTRCNMNRVFVVLSVIFFSIGFATIFPVGIVLTVFYRFGWVTLVCGFGFCLLACITLCISVLSEPDAFY